MNINRVAFMTLKISLPWVFRGFRSNHWEVFWKKGVLEKNCSVKFSAFFMIKTLQTYLWKRNELHHSCFSSQITSLWLFLKFSCTNLDIVFYCVAYCSKVFPRKVFKQVIMMRIEIPFIQFCWLFQSHCFISKTSLCNVD